MTSLYSKNRFSKKSLRSIKSQLGSDRLVCKMDFSKVVHNRFDEFRDPETHAERWKSDLPIIRGEDFNEIQ